MPYKIIPKKILYNIPSRGEMSGYIHHFSRDTFFAHPSSASFSSLCCGRCQVLIVMSMLAAIIIPNLAGLLPR